MSVSQNCSKMYFLNMETSMSTRMGHVGEQNWAETEFLKMKTSTSMRMEHVGEINQRENMVFENENVDVNEDGACR